MAKLKTKSMDRHTKRRLGERYGFRYTQHVKDSLLSAIRSGEARVVVRQSRRVTVYDVDCDIHAKDILDYAKSPGMYTIRCVYDHQRKTFATVLEPDMVPYSLQKEEDMNIKEALERAATKVANGIQRGVEMLQEVMDEPNKPETVKMAVDETVPQVNWPKERYVHVTLPVLGREETIRKRAYFKWIDAGKPEGRDAEVRCWCDAEREHDEQTRHIVAPR